MSGYEILSLDELGPYASENHGDALLIPIRSRLGLRAFGANAWTAEPGKTIVPPHEEDSGNEELYVVVRGRASFTVGDEPLDAPAGTLVHVPPGVHRTAVAEEPRTIVLAVGGTPGQPFAAHGWDDVVVAFAEARAGRVEQGRAVMRALAERSPEDAWEAPYNLACFEARFGDPELAWDHLRRAFARATEELREFARNDSDLASLHDDPRWQELVG
ncbi:MAG TPA: cupin domain-containing protein [Gaiellaceae bacterium]|nr:cupin domain-containing protein [Gaiellaceae bacterium]